MCIRDRLSTLGGPLLLKTLEEIENGEVKPVKQKDEESTYAKMLTREMGELDFQEEAVRLERYVRGLNSWPSAYTHYHGKLLKIWEADVVDNDSEGRPGEIVELQKDGFLIQTGKGLSLIHICCLFSIHAVISSLIPRSISVSAPLIISCQWKRSFRFRSPPADGPNTLTFPAYLCEIHSAIFCKIPSHSSFFSADIITRSIALHGGYPSILRYASSFS